MLLDRLFKVLRSPFYENGSDERLDSGDALKKCYQELSRLGDQLDAHAEKAPYPHVAKILRRLAHEKRDSAKLLTDKMRGLEALPHDPTPQLKTGINHWERMTLDLQDQKALEILLLKHATRLTEAAPAASDLLRQIAARQVSHRDQLLELVARADPQANQSLQA